MMSYKEYKEHYKRGQERKKIVIKTFMFAVISIFYATVFSFILEGFIGYKPIVLFFFWNIIILFLIGLVSFDV